MLIWANLVNDELELELRRRIRKTMKGHNIVDGVFEADLVAAVKPVVTDWKSEKENSKLEWVKPSMRSRDWVAKTAFGEYFIAVDADTAGGAAYLWLPQQPEDSDYFADFPNVATAMKAAEVCYRRKSIEPFFTGCKDKDGNYLFLGDKVLDRNAGPHTKEEYWNPEYEIIWQAPTFTLKHIGGGKDGGSHDFILRCGGGNGNLERIECGPFHDLFKDI
jgi:hypothetical protein